MKVKAILIGAIGIILLFGILLTPKLKTVLKTTASDEFIQLMYDGDVRELTQEQLKQYKDDNIANHLKKFIFLLGKLPR